MWAHKARRLFRDRLVGDKAYERFEAILASVLQSDWSIDMASLEPDGGAFYVTWGHTPSTSDHTHLLGQQLGRLSAADMEEMVAKAIN